MKDKNGLNLYNSKSLNALGNFTSSFGSALLMEGIDALSGQKLDYRMKINFGGVVDFDLSRLGTGESLLSVGNTGLKTDSIFSAMKGFTMANFLNKNMGYDQGKSRISAVNMMGYSKDKYALNTANDIITGKKNLFFEDLNGGEGYSDNNSIFLDNKFLGSGLNIAAKSAIVGVHESVHLDILGDDPREEFVAHKVELGTFRGLANVFKNNLDYTGNMLGDVTRLDIADRMGVLEEYVMDNYDMTGKSWWYRKNKIYHKKIIQNQAIFSIDKSKNWFKIIWNNKKEVL